ncbi:MAG: M12 family metallo-peptidase [Phycisphaerales bacterium]|nr:M12 family metallo-peptidase [Phycisphaerales bacterium]
MSYFQRSFTRLAIGVAATCSLSTLALAAPAGGLTINAACEALSLEYCTIQHLELLPVGEDGYELTVIIEGQARRLSFTPRDVRGENYVLLVQEADGSLVEYPAGPVNTYRGTEAYHPMVRSALGIEEDGFRLRLIDEDQRQWFAEPLDGRVAGADIDAYAVYEDISIISPLNECPVDDGWRMTDLPSSFKSNGANRSGSLLAAEMAVDADYEFFQQYGTVSGVENRVNAVINSVNTQYENQCNLTHEIQTIVVRSTSSDPYSTNNIETRLDQLQAEWNGGNHPGIARDIVHLFTGANTGSTIGLAYLAAVCSSYEYGVVQSNCCGSFGCATDLSAHEMGHNWGAGHCTCPSYTMNPSLVCANQFTSGSISSITSYANSISGCLHVPGPSGACCVGSGCQQLAQSDCTGIGGVFQGDGTVCADVVCEDPTGACCLASGNCATVTESQCSAVGGTYYGDDYPCDAEMCLPDPTGACCYGATCNVTEEADCPGVWIGADTTCDTDPCTSTQFSGISYQVAGVNLVDDPQDTWTVDVFAMVGSGERLDAVAGNNTQLKTVFSTEGFYQNSYGGPTSQGVNPAFYPLVPDLPWDSRVTIGALDSSGDPFPENALNDIGIDFTNFENGGAISADNGTWFVVATDSQGESQPIVTNDCQSGHGVLIARLTAYGLTSEVGFEALFQGRNVLDVTWQATDGTTMTLGNWADCNLNGIADACDIAGGDSQDANGNGVPDECETNCAWDLNGDGSTTVDDLLVLIGGYPDTYNVDDLLALLAEFGCE